MLQGPQIVLFCLPDVPLCGPENFRFLPKWLLLCIIIGALVFLQKPVLAVGKRDCGFCQQRPFAQVPTFHLGFFERFCNHSIQQYTIRVKHLKDTNTTLVILNVYNSCNKALPDLAEKASLYIRENLFRSSEITVIYLQDMNINTQPNQEKHPIMQQTKKQRTLLLSLVQHSDMWL